MFLPTPRNSCTTGTPIRPRCSGSPTPDNCRMCGEPIAPADKITSRLASARSTWPPRENSTPTARLLAPADAVARAGRDIVDVLAVFEPEFLAGLDHAGADRRTVHLRGEE